MCGRRDTHKSRMADISQGESPGAGSDYKSSHSQDESPGAGGGGRRMPMLETTGTGGPPTAGRPSSRRPGPTNAKNRGSSGAASGSSGAADGPAADAGKISAQ